MGEGPASCDGPSVLPHGERQDLSTKVLLLWGNRLGSKATGFVRKPPGFGICLFKASRLPNSNDVLRTTNFPTTSQTQPVRFGELDTLRNGAILVFILTAVVSNI